ncbi:MAG TPA: radical SAM protein [Vicinamibacteria bacterium]
MKGAFYARLLRRLVGNELRRRAGRPAIPYKLLWNTTYYCNSRCRTCNVWQIYPRDGSQKDELQRGDVVRTISSLRSHLLWLTLTGGEPTLKLHAAETVNEVYDACPHLSFITVNSNAIIPAQTERVMKAIASHCRRAEVLVVLSLDGVGRVHDAVRGVPGNFDSVLETRDRVRSLARILPNLGLCFQSTVSRHNLAHVPELIAFCRSLGEEQLVTFAQEAELYRNHGEGHDVTADRAALPAALQAVSRLYRPRHPRDLVQWAHLRLMRRFVATRRAPVSCRAASSTITLGPRGDVSGCLFLDNRIGNVKDFRYDLLALLRSPEGVATQHACGSCNQCWTNCESFTSMVSSPVQTLLRAVSPAPPALTLAPSPAPEAGPHA